MVTQQSNAFISQYRFYQQGLMPYSGGFLEQPAKFMKAMQIIERFKDVE